MSSLRPFALEIIIALAFAFVAYLAYNLFSLQNNNPQWLFSVAIFAGYLLRSLLNILLRAKSAISVSNMSPAQAQEHEPSNQEKLCSVFVGNIAYRANRHELAKLFEPYGKVHTVRIMTDRATRRPRGFGFVEMSEEAAQKAIQALDGADFYGRTLKVNKGNEKSRPADHEQASGAA